MVDRFIICTGFSVIWFHVCTYMYKHQDDFGWGAEATSEISNSLQDQDDQDLHLFRNNMLREEKLQKFLNVTSQVRFARHVDFTERNKNMKEKLSLFSLLSYDL